MAELPDMRARYEQALAEVTEMKRALAERARNVADLETRLMRQVEEGAGRGPSRVVSRRRADVAQPDRSDLARAVAAAEAEKALAQAEREQLDEREKNIRRVERELAGLRVQLEKEWHRLKGYAPTPAVLANPTPSAAPQPPSAEQRDATATARDRATKRR